MSVKVEGNLSILNENDDSSEDEDSDSDNNDNESPTEPLNYDRDNDDDSDEELEVFQYEQVPAPQQMVIGEESARGIEETETKAEHEREVEVKEKKTVPSVPIQKKQDEAPRSLISVMEESVRDLENEKHAKTENPHSLVSMMEKSIQEIEDAKIQAKEARKKAKEAAALTTPTKTSNSKDQNAAFGDFSPMTTTVTATVENVKSKPSAVPPPDAHLASSADAFGIVYRPYGKKKKEYNVPSGPAFEDEAEFERDLLTSTVLKAPPPQVEDDDEFDFDVSQSKTFAEVSSHQPVVSSLGSLKLTTLGAKDDAEYHLDGENSDGDEDDDDDDDQDDNDDPDAHDVHDNSSLNESSDANQTNSLDSQTGNKKETPISTREAARLALAEITGIYSSGLGDHEVTILNSSHQVDDMTTKELSSLAKLGIKNSIIEEIDEEEFERTEEQEIEQEKQTQYLQEKQRSELETQWAAVDSTHQSQIFLPGDDQERDETNYETIRYHQALAIFQNLDLSEYQSKITIDEQQETSWNPLRSDTSLSKANIPKNEIEFPFLIAQVDYNSEQYLPMLRTLYKKLVVEQGNRHLRCPPTGPHWEPLGFQGNDPRTDLNRSMKMLSVLQMLHMLEVEKGMTQRLFVMSLGSGAVIASPTSSSGNVRDLDDSWPFMLVGIQMTKNTIDALRSGSLTKDVNQQKSVLTVANEYHHACFYCYLRALTEHPQIHHAAHLSSLRNEVSSNPIGILRAYRNSKAPKPKPKSGSSSAKGEIEYTGLDDNQQQGQGVGQGAGQQADGGKKEKKSWLSFGKSSKEKKFLMKNNPSGEDEDEG